MKDGEKEVIMLKAVNSLPLPDILIDDLVLNTNAYMSSKAGEVLINMQNAMSTNFFALLHFHLE